MLFWLTVETLKAFETLIWAERLKWKPKLNVKGTTAFVRPSFIRLLIPRLDTDTNHSIEMGMFPDLYSFPDQFIEIEASPTVAYPD